MKGAHTGSRAGHLVLTFLLLVPLPLSPATITVEGACTLPDAITAANTDSPVGGCTAGSGTDNVELTGNVTLTEIDNGDNGLPLVTSSIGIEGNGFTVRRHPAAPEFRFFEVWPDGTLRLEDVVLSSGSVYDDGGAVLTLGTLVLENTQITDSSAVVGGAIAATNFSSTTITNSSLSNNHAIGYGGGLYSGYVATTMVTDSTITDNYAGWWEGGGIFAYGAITVSGSTISGNYGSGLQFTYNASAVTDSLIKDNTGSGVFNRQSAEVTIINSTISGNQSYSGVGMYHSFEYGFTELINTTVVGNSPYGVDLRSFLGEITLTNTVVAYNSVAGCGGSPMMDGGGNFDDDGSCPGASPITGLDPVLADNGGPTLTHALLPGSSAVDAAGDCGLSADQRGFGRDALCDSGAFELGAAAVVGASVEGLNAQLATCSNLTAGGKVDIPSPSSWNCRSEGLAIESGDRVRQTVRGRPAQVSFVGSVEGVDGPTVACQNLTTGQVVQVALGVETSWDCREQGLLFEPTDRVSWTVIGNAL
jgi:hypothetical protein